MRVGTLCPLHDLRGMHTRVEQGFECLELVAPHDLSHCPTPDLLPAVPLIWQAPPDLPTEHPAPQLKSALLAAWQAQLAAAHTLGAVLMVVQFRRSPHLANKAALIGHYSDLLLPLVQAGRQLGVQIVLRNSPDNRDQLQLLREIIRSVPGLGLALDVAYTHQKVVKNLTNEYLWDSDLAPRLAHLYASDTDAQNADLRLPLGSTGIPDWARLARLIRERYNGSVTIDVGSADADYYDLSRMKWLAWWAK